MHNNKKASPEAGQKLNHDHFPVSVASRQSAGDDYQKPSRQNRRQKRTWKRKPRLTQGRFAGHHGAVPETEGNEIGVSNNNGGLSATLADFLRPSRSAAPFSMVGLAGEGEPSPVPLFRYANPASACHPIGVGSRLHLPNNGAAAMRNPSLSGKPAHIPTLAFHLALFRALRRFIGPALAYRLAFAGRAA